jgi:hypothetical protein
MPRQNERVTFLTEVDLEFASGKRSARISDISMGGCYMESIIQVQKGERFDFDITSTTGESARFAGEVAYVFDGMGFGVKFIDLDDSSRTFLQRIIDDKS